METSMSKAVCIHFQHRLTYVQRWAELEKRPHSTDDAVILNEVHGVISSPLMTMEQARDVDRKLRLLEAR